MTSAQDPMNPYSTEGRTTSVPDAPTELRHSGFGIASFVIFLTTLVATVAVFAWAGYAEATTPGGIDETTGTAIAIGLLIMGCLLLQFIGLILGIVGLMQKGRRKIFAGLGVGLNGMIVLLIAFVIFIGMSMG